jgi:2-polyprenyl-6-methoxyphenol hydroxylase-like FAD-dependent oxidoreductase
MRRMANPRIDPEALSGALRALGMLDAASLPAALTREARDEADAIRAYIRRERPHLLSCYDLESLVRLVKARYDAEFDQPPALEPA